MGEVTEEFEKMYNDALYECGEPFLRIVGGREVVSCRGSANRKVYVLQDEHGKKSVLKQFSIDQAERLKTEHDILLGASNPGLPAAGEYSEDGEWAYLTREYVEGMNLAELTALRGKLSVNEAADIGMVVCDILSDLHGRDPQVIHRDIKPENIIYTPEKRVVLIDFDISRTYDASARNDTVYLGTKTTAPPEQFGYGQTDPRSDIYSLGVVLIYLCTAGYDIKNLDSLPKQYAAICAKCTDFAPSGRYQSAAELKRQLKLMKNGAIRRVAWIAAAAVCCGALIWGGYTIGKANSAAREALAVPVETPDSEVPQTEQTAPAEDAVDTQTPVDIPAVVEPPAAEFDGAGSLIFVSPLVEQFVREQVDKTGGEPVTEEDMLKIGALVMYGDRIFTEGKETYWDNGVEYVDGAPVSYYVLEGLEDIARMKNLQRLELHHVELTDISLLCGLNRLSFLSVKDTPVSDISCLAPLVRLEGVSICGTYVSDISVIEHWPRLNSLDMNGAPCTDYSPLESVPYFEFLDISGEYALNAIPYIEGKVVQVLKLNNAHLTDISPFFTVQGLIELHAQNNNLTSLEGIGQLETVRYVDVGGNTGITDYSPLLEMPALEYLSWRKTESTAPVDGILKGARFKLNMVN